jgi:hypothetical protein
MHGKIKEVDDGDSVTMSIYANFEDTLYLLPDRIEPIAPRGIGYSYGAQPNLYFYMDKPSSRPIEFNLLREEVLDPVVVHHIMVDPESKVIDPGIHMISLEELGIVLEEDIEYEWVITIVVDLMEYSSNIVANGIVVYQPNPEIDQALSSQNLPEYGVYSENGYWYDAIDAAMLLKKEEGTMSFIDRQLIHWLDQEKLSSTIAFLDEF